MFPSTGDRLPALSWKQVFSIGIYAGHSPFDFVSPQNIDKPVLSRSDVTDVPAVFVADPFMLRVNRTWYMFLEVMNHRAGRGEIGLAISNDTTRWTYQHIVLTEPFHLSYPYVFKVQDEYYMLPETHQAKAIRLYKAVDFPTRWAFVGTLLEGREYTDPSIFYYREKWWMFSGLGTRPSRSDTLRLYYAE